MVYNKDIYKIKTVQDLIDRLQKFDPNMKVIGADSVELDCINKTETVCTENSVAVKNVGFETVVVIR